MRASVRHHFLTDDPAPSTFAKEEASPWKPWKDWTQQFLKSNTLGKAPQWFSPKETKFKKMEAVFVHHFWSWMVTEWDKRGPAWFNEDPSLWQQWWKALPAVLKKPENVLAFALHPRFLNAVRHPNEPEWLSRRQIEWLGWAQLLSPSSPHHMTPSDPDATGKAWETYLTITAQRWIKRWLALNPAEPLPDAMQQEWQQWQRLIGQPNSMTTEPSRWDLARGHALLALHRARPDEVICTVPNSWLTLPMAHQEIDKIIWMTGREALLWYTPFRTSVHESTAFSEAAVHHWKRQLTEMFRTTPCSPDAPTRLLLKKVGGWMYAQGGLQHNEIEAWEQQCLLTAVLKEEPRSQGTELKKRARL